MFKHVLFIKLKIIELVKQTDMEKKKFSICIAMENEKQNKLSGYFKKTAQITFMMKLIKVHTNIYFKFIHFFFS